MPDLEGSQYLLMGSLRMSTKQFAGDTNEVVNYLDKIDKKARAVFKTLNGEYGTKNGSSTSGAKKSIDDTVKALQTLKIENQKYSQSIKEASTAYKAGQLSIDEYRKSLETLKSSMATQASTLVGKGQTEQLASSEKAYVSTFNRINSELARLNANQAKTFDSATVGAQKFRTELSGLKSQYDSGNISAAGYLDRLKKLRDTMQGEYNGIQTKGQTQKLSSGENQYIKQYQAVEAQIDKTEKRLKQFGNTTKEVNLSTRETIKTLLGWDIARQGVFMAVQYLKQGLSTLKDIDTYLINIQKVTDQTDGQMQEVAATATKVAIQFGRLTTDYLEALEAFSRIKTIDASKFAEMSLLLQNVGDVEADVSQETLIAINAGFQLNGSYEKLISTIDAMNEISNNNATTITKMSEAIKVSASTANVAGLSFNQYIALIGTATAVTQREGSQIGNAMRTMFLSIEQVASATDNVNFDKLGKAAQAIRNLGVEMRGQDGELRGVYDILSDVAEKWDTLRKNQKMAFAQAVGNKRQADVIVGIMNNWSMVQKQLNEANNSQGSAMKENETYMKSWQAHINTFISTATQGFENFVNSDGVVKFVDIGTGLLEFLDKAAPAILALAGAYATLNKNSVGFKVVGSLFGNANTFKTNVIEKYKNALIGCISPTEDITLLTKEKLKQEQADAVEMVNSGTAMEKFTTKTKAAGTALFGTLSTLQVVTTGIIALITVLTMMQQSYERTQEARKELVKNSGEEIESLTSDFKTQKDNVQSLTEEYIKLATKYKSGKGSLGGLTSDEFETMITKGTELSSVLKNVGLSFNIVDDAVKNANGSLSSLTKTTSTVISQFKQAYAKTMFANFSDIFENLNGNSLKGGVGQYLNGAKVFSLFGLNDKNSNKVLVSNLMDQADAADSVVSAFDRLMKIQSKLSPEAALFGTPEEAERLKSVTDLYVDLQGVANLPINEQVSALTELEDRAFQLSQTFTDLGKDDLASDFQYVSSSITEANNATKEYLSSQTYLINVFDVLRDTLGESVVSPFEDTYNALKSFAKETNDTTAIMDEFVYEFTGATTTASDAQQAYIKSTDETLSDEEQQKYLDTVENYLNLIEEFDNTMSGITDKKYSLGNFEESDTQLEDLKNQIHALIDLYNIAEKNGDTNNLNNINEAFSGLGISGGIDQAIESYIQLSNATLDLSQYTKDLTSDEQSEVETLVNSIDAVSIKALKTKDLAQTYADLAEENNTTLLGQANLRKAYLDVANAMGLSEVQTQDNINAILTLASANTVLSDSDEQRIISQASVSEAAKQATLTILKSKKAQLEEELATARGAVNASNTSSQAAETEAKNVKGAIDSQLYNLRTLQEARMAAIEGRSFNTRTATYEMTEADSAYITSLENQITTVNQLIATVNAITPAVKSASSGSSSAASDAADTISDAIQKVVDDTSEKLDKISDAIDAAYEKGEISAKEAYGRVTNELASLQSYYEGIISRPKSEWTDYEQMVAEHYQNLIDQQKDYLQEIEDNYNDAVSKVEDLQDTLVDALQKKYEQQREDRIDLINKEKDSEIGLYDARIKALQDQIDALQDETEEKTKNLDSLKRKLEASRADTSAIGIKRTAELEAEVADLEKELQISALEKEQSDLEDQKSEREQYYEDLLNEDSEYYDSTLAMLDNCLKESSLYAEANKLIVSNSTQDMVDLISTYAPDYSGVGQMLGQSLSDATLDTVEVGLDGLDIVLEGKSTYLSTYIAQAQQYVAQADQTISQLEQRMATIKGSTSTSNTSTYSPSSPPSPSTPSSSSTPSYTIKDLQEFLNNNLGTNLVVDGVFGEKTGDALINWLIKSVGRDSSLSETQMNTWSKNLMSARDSNTINSTVLNRMNKYLPNYYPLISGRKSYIKGGIADFTGIAWLDGTKQRPERILPAPVTQTFDDFVYKFLPRFMGIAGASKDIGGNAGAMVTATVTQTNNIYSAFDVKKAYKDMESAIVKSIQRSGINP